MRRVLFQLFGWTALLIGIFVGFCSCAGKGPSTPVNLETFLDDIEKKAYLIRQFSAEFVKTRRSTIFNQPLTVNARLIFQKPNYFMLSLKGDVNVEILSNGKFITLIHDQDVVETHQVQGDRDLSRFADPLMLLIDQIGTGALRRFHTLRQEQQGDSVLMEIEPDGNWNQFERIKSVTIIFAVLGEIRSVDINFKNGDQDHTVFGNWLLLADNDPDILELKKRLKSIAEKSPTAAGMIQPTLNSSLASILPVD